MPLNHIKEMTKYNLILKITTRRGAFHCVPFRRFGAGNETLLIVPNDSEVNKEHVQFHESVGRIVKAITSMIAKALHSKLMNTASNLREDFLVTKSKRKKIRN